MSTTENLEPGLVYDAVALFGFGDTSDESVPAAEPGVIVIRYGGWSPQELRDSDIGKKFMHQQDWYNAYRWSTERLPPGIYRLCVSVPNSNRKSVTEQEQMLPAGEQMANLVLLETVLIAHRLQSGEDLLKKDWTRCKEQTALDYPIVLCWNVGRLAVGGSWNASYRSDRLWLSSVRTSES